MAPADGVEKALAEFVNDADMLGTTLAGYAKRGVTEVIGVGRAGSLVDWDGDVEGVVDKSRVEEEGIANFKSEISKKGGK